MSDNNKQLFHCNGDKNFKNKINYLWEIEKPHQTIQIYENSLNINIWINCHFLQEHF